MLYLSLSDPKRWAVILTPRDKRVAVKRIEENLRNKKAPCSKQKAVNKSMRKAVGEGIEPSRGS
jgi:prolyl-tRNA editing enzyme YbaK/EbsC (Cys-tRNA(Pro) deacylase)